MNDSKERVRSPSTSDWWRFPIRRVSQMDRELGQRFWSRLISLTRKEIRQLLRDPEQPGHRYRPAYRADPDFRLRSVARCQECAGGGGAGRPFAHGGRCSRGPGALHLHLADRGQLHARCRAPDAGARGGCHRAHAERFFPPARRPGDAQVQLLVHGAEASRATIIRSYVSSCAGSMGAAPGRSCGGQRRRPAAQSPSMSACGSMPPIPAPGTWCRG